MNHVSDNKKNHIGYTSIDRYEAHFASTLRGLMAHNGTTQKELAAFVGIRPQSLAQYCSGETQPNGDKLLKIAEYYGVTVDYLLTGTIIENIPVYEFLGLSENTVQNIKLVRDGYFEDTPGMLAMLDCLLSDKDFYGALQQAAQWSDKKQGAVTECQEYCEWKAAKYLQDYFLEFFQRDFTSAYVTMQEREALLRDMRQDGKAGADNG